MLKVWFVVLIVTHYVTQEVSWNDVALNKLVFLFFLFMSESFLPFGFCLFTVALYSLYSFLDPLKTVCPIIYLFLYLSD